MLRLQIIATGQFLVMDPTITLTVEKNSTLFNDTDDFLGSLTYDGQLPLQPNKALLENKHYINVSAQERTIDVLAWLGDLPWKQVVFTYTRENETINYTLLIDNGIIAAVLKTTTLQQIGRPDDQLLLGSYDALAAYMLETVNGKPGEYPMVFFPFKDTAAYKTIPDTDYASYPDLALPVNPYINAWDSTNQKFILDTPVTPQAQSQAPAIYLAFVLKRMIEYFGYTYEGRWLDDPDSNRICIQSLITININLIGNFFSYLPAMTLPDFVKLVRDEFELVIDFDQTRKVCVVESIKYLQSTSNFINLQNAQLANQYRETGDTTTGYTISQGVDDKDAAFTDQDKTDLPVLIIGDGTTGITLNSVVTKMLIEQGPVTVNQALWKIPDIEQIVYPRTPFDQISSMTEAGRNDFKIRFLYFHGLVPDAAGFNYPFASFDNKNYAGSVISNYSLELTSNGGVFQATNDKYNFLLNSKPFEQGFKLTREDFFNITPAARIIVRDFNNASIPCLLDQISADLTNEDIIFAKAILYPIVFQNNLPADVPAVPVTPPVVIPPVDNGIVYIRLEQRSHDNYQHQYPPPGWHEVKTDLWVSFWMDSAATTPKQVTNLSVRYQTNLVNDGSGVTNSTEQTVILSGTEAPLQLQASESSSQGTFFYWFYNLLPTAHYTIIT